MEILDISHTRILNHLRDSLRMKLFHVGWLSDQLTEQLRASRIQKCQELLPLLEMMETNKFCNILTDDEGWLMLECQHAAKWSLSHENRPKKVRRQIGTKIYAHCYLGNKRLSCY
jgi:hypothetical protein